MLERKIKTKTINLDRYLWIPFENTKFTEPVTTFKS